MHQLSPGGSEPELIAGTVLVENRRDRRGQRRGRCRALLALPPPGILELAVSAPLPLPGFRRPRALLRVLLLEVSSVSPLLQPNNSSFPFRTQSLRWALPL